MPLVIGVISVVLLVSAIRGTTSSLFTLVRGDFTGQNNFLYWFVAIAVIGAFGYIPRLRPVSTGLLGLVLVVLFLKNGNSSAIGGGFFNQFSQGLASTQTATTAAQPATAATASTTSSAFSNFLSSLGIGSNSSPAPTVAPAVSANPSIFPPPTPGTAPQPTLSQLGLPSLGSLGIGTMPVQ
jgi:hypothetical protein